jgi:hypothetical protein
MENMSFEQAIQVVQSLLPEDQQRLRQWFEEKEQKQVRQEINGESETESFREREMRWISEHRDEYIGQWVALDGDRLLSHGEDLNKVFDKAQAQGVNAPFTAFIEDPQQPWMGGW